MDTLLQTILLYRDPVPEFFCIIGLTTKLNNMIKNLLLLTAVSLMLVQCAQKDNEQWELAWSDEFDYSGAPADSLWGYETGYVRNNELQKYTNLPANVRVEDGVCVIECRMEEDSTITSAAIITKGKKDIRYGRVEVRAKIPSALGTWPAIWLLGNNISEVGWPACGELDIMEHVGYDPAIIHANVHTKAYNHVKGNGKGNSINAGEPWQDFHVYAMNWYEGHLDFFYDDSLYLTYENDLLDDPDTWPFNEPHYLLINLAFGGGWGGSQGVDMTALPVKFLVDYVRVYEGK